MIRKQRSNKNAIERQERSKFGMYKGPINVGESSSTGKIDVVNLHSTTTLSTNGLGTLALELSFNPSGTNEWPSFSARYREYRVLAVQLDVHPILVANTTSIAGAPLVVGTNKGPTLGTPSSYVQVYSLAKSSVHHVMKRFIYTIRPDDYTDLDVGSTAAPASEFSALFYGDGMTISTLFMRVFITWVVQFSSQQ